MRSRAQTEDTLGSTQTRTPRAAPSVASLKRSQSDSNVMRRPEWNDRHHLLFSRENELHPNGMRDYFDRPRELRITVPEGHDGVSEPFELRPSLHFLKVSESPKMQRLRGKSWDSGGSSPRRGRAATTDVTPDEPDSPLTPLARAQSELALTPRRRGGQWIPDCAVGSQYGSPTKPDFQRSQSWLNTPEKVSSEDRRKPTITQASTHYSQIYGSAGGTGAKGNGRKPVPWNNRWHLCPSTLGPNLHPAYRETFASPSRMYTSTTEAWRHMYGDRCELLNTRVPGVAQEPGPYGYAALKRPVIVPAAVKKYHVEVVDGPSMGRTRTEVSAALTSMTAETLPPL